MGIALDTGKFYGLEFAIIGVVAAMALLPIIIAVEKAFADGIADEKV